MIEADYYSENYKLDERLPAFPVLRGIRLECPGRNWSAMIPEAFVDTGADRSHLPKNLVDPLLRHVDLIGLKVNGELCTGLCLTICLPSIEISVNRIIFAVWDDDEVLIGRDILNQVLLSLRGAPHKASNEEDFPRLMDDMSLVLRIQELAK